MQSSYKKTLILLLLPISLIVANTTICYANAPPPPTLSVVVANAPKDLEIHVGSEKAWRTDRVFESYFNIYIMYTSIYCSPLRGWQN